MTSTTDMICHPERTWVPACGSSQGSGPGVRGQILRGYAQDDRRRARLTTGFFVLTVLAMITSSTGLGCAEEKRPALRTVPMTIGSKEFTLEVADTDASREHG